MPLAKGFATTFTLAEPLAVRPPTDIFFMRVRPPVRR